MRRKFWFVHIPFVNIVRFKLYSRFSEKSLFPPSYAASYIHLQPVYFIIIIIVLTIKIIIIIIIIVIIIIIGSSSSRSSRTRGGNKNMELSFKRFFSMISPILEKIK